ncbi:hypothetical protein [Acinetobacter defluvii]|uniref:hypothetical protein n=1 Tax=Acinetobacter defluvii TaxID=1871111 RepID=UPI00148FAC48|nr:hypothetical protein [Acinetobacter defluvii]
MSMVNLEPYRCFKLKPSRYWRWFQLFLGVAIIILLYPILTLWLWLLCVLLLTVSGYMFSLKPQVAQFEQLDGQIWSLKFVQNQKIQHVKIKQMIDHIFYIVIYVEDVSNSNKLSSFIVWQDQLAQKSWKMLKTQAKLA